jgi:EAL domain-containing protein (putative c-di-GMP-specific phosphodiesterase class I)
MHQAKESGCNSIVVYDVDSGRKDGILRRADIAQRVREALTGEGFELHTQPIVALAPGEADREEVLLRLRDRDGTLLSAAEFIPAAEGFGLMAQLDRWVVSASLAYVGRCQDAGVAMLTHVNLSAQSLGDTTMPDFISTAIEEHGVDARRLVFEVTETAAIDNVELARAFLSQLRELGCGLALDDFGAGYGSFRHLKHLPFDVMKIDGDFIRDLPRSECDLVMVRALVGAAAGLGKQVVAEFVSDDETVELLRALGVDYVQGFHVGMPAPIAAAPAQR